MNPELLAAELHALADFIAANPKLVAEANMQWVFCRTLVSIDTHPDPKTLLAGFARAGARTKGVEVAKSFDDSYGNVDLRFGEYVNLHVYATREKVCRREVVGTKEVTEQIPDPDAPLITRTRTEEVVEWTCEPLLAVAPEASKTAGAR